MHGLGDLKDEHDLAGMHNFNRGGYNRRGSFQLPEDSDSYTISHVKQQNIDQNTFLRKRKASTG